MLWLYRVLFLPALLVVLPFFLWRTRGRGGWQQKLGNRFGRFTGIPAKQAGVKRIWLHAVSVGELMAIAPLLEPLRRQTGAEVFLTTTTTTGLTLADERLRSAVIGLGYFPIDFWPWSARAWREIAPDLAILAEGERWPEHIHQGARRGVPVVCVNARLSDRGFRRARRFRWIALPLWRSISAILAGSETDARRFLALGFPEDRVQTTGSIKLDVEIPRLAPEQQARLRQELGIGEGPLIVGASTWPGEETTLIQVLRDLRARGLPARLLLVPRHAERRAELAALLSATEFSRHFRSHGPSPVAVDVAVGDTTGELRSFLQLADLVFVGRSLPPHTEGQTPVEAAILERPLVFGPGMANFRDIASGLVASGAAVVLHDAGTRSDTFFRLLTDVERRRVIAQNLRIWSATGKGAIARTCVAVADTIAGQDHA